MVLILYVMFGGKDTDDNVLGRKEKKTPHGKTQTSQTCSYFHGYQFTFKHGLSMGDFHK